MSDPRRGSVLFALLSGLLSSVFLGVAGWNFFQLRLPVSVLALGIVLFAWSGLFTVGFFVWGLQHRELLRGPKADGRKFFGQETFATVGGVSAAILTAVTFLLVFANDVKLK